MLFSWPNLSTLAGGALIAQTRVPRSGYRFRSVASVGNSEFWLYLTAIVFSALLAYGAWRWKERWRHLLFHNPWILFWEMCSIHELELRKRILLLRLAYIYRLKNPVQLFLQPERFSAQDPTFVARTAVLPGRRPRWPIEPARMEEIRKQLFGR